MINNLLLLLSLFSLLVGQRRPAARIDAVSDRHAAGAAAAAAEVVVGREDATGVGVLAARSAYDAYCRWTDSRTGNTYDLTPLANIDTDYYVPSGMAGDSYYVNLCTPLVTNRCRSTPTAVVCVAPPGPTDEAVATSVFYAQSALPGSGSSAGVTLSFGSGSRPDAIFHLLCLESGTAGSPALTTSTNAHVAFIWQSIYACPTNTAQSPVSSSLLAAPIIGGTISFVMFVACCALCGALCVRRCRHAAAEVAPSTPSYGFRAPREDPPVGPDVCVLCRERTTFVSFASCPHKCCCASCVAKAGFACPVCTAANLRANLKTGDPSKAAGADGESNELELQSMDDGKDKVQMPECLVCLERPSDIVFIPCGHLCVCSGCAPRIEKRCPYCNGEFSSKQKIFADL